MNLIAIETSTENCAVGLSHQGKITQRSLIAPQKHAELVLGYLDELLDEQGLKKSDIDGIVFGQGPGAFTGVRIATSIVQGLALALDVPVMAVSTLHNLAQQISNLNPEKSKRILVANDARMGEVYWATFETQNQQLLQISPDALSQPNDIKAEGFDVCVGSAFKSMIEVNDQIEVYAERYPDATTLLKMAETNFQEKAKNIKQITPSYIREKVVFN